MATREQIKRIYGLGAGLGIVGKDRDDMLHEVIYSITHTIQYAPSGTNSRTVHILHSIIPAGGRTTKPRTLLKRVRPTLTEQ